MDNRGNIVIEVAIVLIVILMIAGIVLNLSENITQKAVKATERENTELMISEVIDNLINNPGVPQNWNEYKKGTPGLAIVNEHDEIIPNSVSYEKFSTLGKNYKKLVSEKIFGSKVKTSMELIPKSSGISSVKIGDDSESENIYSVNRLVKCDFFKKFVIKDFQNEGKCNHGHKQNSHSCNYFKIFKGNLKKTNYYLIIDKDEKSNLKYMVDTTRVVKARFWESPSSEIIYLNDKINFYDDTSAVVFVHFNKANAKAVLISTPKTFKINDLNYDYFTTNECNLILKAWY
ncbi:hypothetical protein [uncultured Methanobrevibacter sp.]|uniref:hypothetical protein n=1 Tax=uncultured Methanobrevibacter sp. TaxID=253161 RepID=UPI0025E5E85F|nr:hypothetical protein [uncultured Methanobrevibacter sp.]